MSEGKRIKQLRKELGITLVEFGAKIHRVKSTISQIENEKEPLSPSLRSAICHTFNINEEWLLSGQGEKFNNPPPPSIKEIMADYIIKDKDAAPDALFSSDQKINIEEAMGKTYKVLSAGTALSVALYMNIQQFAAALDTGQALKKCEEQMAEMQLQINALNRKVDALTAPSTAGRQGDGSEKEAM